MTAKGPVASDATASGTGAVPTCALWLEAHPLILASRSQARRQLLQAVGLPHACVPADIDERGLERQFAVTERTGGAVAELLATRKAQAVGAGHSGRLVVGADQTLTLGEEIFAKPADRAAAARQLKRLAGHTHVLHSAVAVVQDGNRLFAAVGQARMTMRSLSEDFIERYLDAAGPAVTSSVGAYQVEGLGIHLFDAIEGDHATILGLPLLPLIAFLRTRGSVLQ